MNEYCIKTAAYGYTTPYDYTLSYVISDSSATFYLSTPSGNISNYINA
jgi:hypothetical protein